MTGYFIHATVDEWHVDGNPPTLYTEEYWIEAESEQDALDFFDSIHEDRTQDFESMYHDLPEIMEVRK